MCTINHLTRHHAMNYQPQTFAIAELTGISARTIEEHLGLYRGYVASVNHIHERIEELAADPERNGYAIAELQRRLGFEFGGMKNHEYYFAQFEHGARPLPEGTLRQLLQQQWGSVEAWEARYKALAATRGVGWAMLCYDPHAQRLVQTWVDEQHIGQLADARIVLALDMWEHSYMLDYPPSRKKEYIERFFDNVNFEVVAARLSS